MHSHLLQVLPRLLLLLALLQPITATAGYHYDRPTAPTAPSYHGHQFASLSTIRPLPPVPALPALPTPRSHGQTLLQTPPSAPAATIVRQYYPPKTASTYLTPAATPYGQVSYHGTHSGGPSNVLGQPLAPQALRVSQHVAAHAAPIHVVPTAPAFVQQSVRLVQPHAHYGAPPTALGAVQQQQHVPQYVHAAAQPLRVPYGKTALISPGESYSLNGRQLKQYAVIEIIDNDIDQNPPPFLRSSFIDQYRAHAVGGTGPSAAGGVQIESRANSAVLQQQAQGALRTQQGDAIALGSGGLGYIQLPNGNVYLGSGSLGYISGQQRVASVRDVRTRAETAQGPLHFGHGALGGASNFLRFK